MPVCVNVCIAKSMARRLRSCVLVQWCMFDSYAITAVLHKRIRGTNLVQVLLVVLDINRILYKACAEFKISLCSINIDID